MKFGLVLASASALALTSCNGGGTADIALTNATQEQIQKAVEDSPPPTQPGEWETRIEMVSLELPGMPDGPERDAAMVQMMPPPQTRKACVTAEQAKAGDFTRLANAAKDCRFPKFNRTGDRIDFEMACTGPNGPIRATVQGTQTATAVDVKMTQDQPLTATVRSKAEVHVTAKRLGECRS